MRVQAIVDSVEWRVRDVLVSVCCVHEDVKTSERRVGCGQSALAYLLSELEKPRGDPDNIAQPVATI